MIQIIISIVIFVLVGIVGVNTVKAGKYFCCIKVDWESTQRLSESIGNFLGRQGINSAQSTKLIDAISRGISEEELKSMLSEMGASEIAIQNILSRLDAMGAATDTPPIVSESQKQAAPALTIKTKSSPPVKSPDGGVGGTESSDSANLITGEEQAKTEGKGIIKRDNGGSSLEEIKIVKDRETQKLLRAQFKESIKTAKDEGDVRKIGSIAVAHAYGMRVANRFQAAIARLENIINRLESRTAKLKAEGYDISEVVPVIEEARNMLAESKAKLVEIEALYEELLASDNPREVAKEAAAKTKELKNDLSLVMQKVVTPSGQTIVRNIKRPL